MIKSIIFVAFACWQSSVLLPFSEGRLFNHFFINYSMQKPWYKSAIKRFRTIALCEGVSFLVLLFIAMPLKYFAGFPHAVMIVGWAHGLLFITYMISGLDVKIAHQWSFNKTSLAVVASLVPFGTFVLDKRMLKKEMGSSF